MEINNLIERLFEYWLKTGFKRFLFSIVVLGVTLLGLSWTDVVTLIIDKVSKQQDPEPYVTLAHIVGISLICIGILARVVLQIVEVKNNEKRIAAKLIGRLRVLVKGFEDQSVSRDAGYFNNEIIHCQKAAKEYQEVAPKRFAANPIMSAVSNPKFDASKRRPYIDITLDEIETLTNQMGEHYGIK